MRSLRGLLFLALFLGMALVIFTGAGYTQVHNDSSPRKPLTGLEAMGVVPSQPYNSATISLPLGVADVPQQPMQVARKRPTPTPTPGDDDDDGDGGDDDPPPPPPPHHKPPQGHYCCDGYGNRRCQIVSGSTNVGDPCFCPGQGYGVICR
jgi:hypothetical protein